MKKVCYVVLALLIPVLVATSCVYSLDKYLDYKNNKMMEVKDLYPMLHDTVSLVKDKGVYANNYLAHKGAIMIMGSSELSHSTRQHPDYYFNTGRTKDMAVTIGRAYTQSLQHATIVGSLDNKIKNKKVVLLLSMQWFMEKKGVTAGHFLTRFSPVQFYNFMSNPKISQKTKKDYAKRISNLMKEPGEFKPEAIYANLYLHDDLGHKTLRMLFSPYFKARRVMVSMKDKGITYKALRKLYNKVDQSHDIAGQIDWDKEKEYAEIEAKNRVGNKIYKLGGRDVYVDKGYYKEYMKGKDEGFRGFYSYVKLTDSKEYTDFNIFLEACRDMGVKPTIVIIPGMPEFYDFAGIGPADRKAFANKIKKISSQYDTRLIDLMGNENKRYYLRDIMHLGTLGWADLSEKIYNIYER